MLSAQRPMKPNESSAASTTSVARQPHQRRLTATSTTPTPTKVIPFSRSVSDVTSQFSEFEIGFRT